MTSFYQGDDTELAGVQLSRAVSYDLLYDFLVCETKKLQSLHQKSKSCTDDRRNHPVRHKISQD